MKRGVFIRICCLAIMAININNAQADNTIEHVPTQVTHQQDAKPVVREFGMSQFSIAHRVKQLELGAVHLYDFGSVKLHAYETKDPFNTFVFILEKLGQAVLLETPPLKSNYQELTNYILSLGHQQIDLVVSYHPIGAQFIETPHLKFKNIYSMQHAVDNYKHGLGASSLVGLKQRFGQAFDETVYQPTMMLDEGSVQIAGIQFFMTHADFAFDMAIPEINAVHSHMLGHDKHALIFSMAFLDAAIQQLERFQQNDYEFVFSSHAQAETRGDVSIKLAYYHAFKRILKASKTKSEFIAAMQQAFPGYGWSFYLEGSANFLFNPS